MNKTIIAVEDDSYYQKYYQRLFSKKYNFISIFNGAEAIEQIEKHKPDLLILDMDIPGKTGRSIVIDVKKINKNVPIIVVSSKEGIKSDPEMELSKQVRYFFRKPVRFKDVAKVVEDVLVMENLELPTVSWEGKKVLGCAIQERIGAGGSGQVYRAKYIDRPVAVKMLRLVDSEHMERYRCEIVSLAKIQHPNVIKLLNSDALNDTQYCIVMELFDGQTLSECLKEREYLSLQEAIYVVREIAKGLEATHRQQIIHRDVKPSNILYNSQRKELKIVDFGITKLVQKIGVTVPGQVVGTPLYMSPEQCIGEKVDHRCDIYNLGLIFFELLAGYSPFARPSILEIMQAQTEEEIVWPSHLDIPQKVKQIIEKMTQKNRDERFASMQQVIEALE